MFKSIEIKASCKTPNKIRGILLKNKADYKGTDHQIDTYFKVAKGRLKLREGKIENALIHYERENKNGPKQSKITMFQTNKTSALKDTLTKSTGILVIVDKLREIYYIDNVKFHIDKVKRLGSFMEIEAIDKDGSIGKKKLLKQCNYYLKLFGVDKKDLIAVSYSDLLLKKP